LKLPVQRKSSKRRQEARRKRSETRETFVRRLSRSVGPSVLLIWLGFYVVTLVVILSGSGSMPWRHRQRVDSDIVARVGFTIEDIERTQKDRELARDMTADVYTANEAPIVAITGKLTQLLELAKSSAGAKDKLAKQSKEKGWSIEDKGLAKLIQYAADEKGQEDYGILIQNLTGHLGEEHIVLVPEDKPRPKTPTYSVLRRKGTVDVPVHTILQLQHITDRKKLDETARKVVKGVNCPAELIDAFSTLIVHTLAGADPNKPVYNPLWRYDKAATLKAIDEAVKQVKDHTIPYNAGDVLVRRGTVLLDDEMNLLEHEHREYRKAEKTDPQFFTEERLKQLGTAIVVLLLTVGMVTYVASYQDRVFQKPARALGLSALILLMLILARLIVYPFYFPVELTVACVVIATALLAIAYDQRFAFGVGGALALLVTLTAYGDLGLFFTLLVAMGVTVFSLKEIRSRSKIIAVGTMVAFGAFITSFAINLIAGHPLVYVCTHALVAAAAAVGAGFVVQGILPNFEKLFGIATSMTLLEWCDVNRPLLRRLAQEAPGTYSHSLVIGQMCEVACEAIGSRGLLGRVGALYHDVGKLQKLDYFVENQEARMNRHDQLSPTMSLLIIIGHVKDGIEMSRAYGLPRILHQFIAEHHGTTVVRYFHHMATEAAAKNGKTKGRHDREVPESEFRYPGPKPRSKESAILMLCDTCEGAVRALSEPTPGRIESTVHNMVMDRLNDGQFDDCDITLRELKIVEQSMVKSLCAIHHSRIKYPKAEEETTPKPLPEGGGENGPAHDRGEASAHNSDETTEVARKA